MKKGSYAHGGFINAKDPDKDGEWVLVRGDGGREKWMRIKWHGWREWIAGKREIADYEVVVRVEEGIYERDWVVFQ
jgi:hypothetical protein